MLLFIKTLIGRILSIRAEPDDQIASLIDKSSIISVRYNDTQSVNGVLMGGQLLDNQKTIADYSL